MRELTTLTNRFNTIFIGMDVHKRSVSLCSFTLEHQTTFCEHKIEADNYFDQVLAYVQNVRGSYDLDAKVVCGYEAGCTGFGLYRFLLAHGIECELIAPNSILEEKDGRKIKTDRRDAQKIAKALAYGSYKNSHVPTPEEEEVRNYLRMRDDLKLELKRIKQNILSFCLSHHLQFDGKTPWTHAHIQWLDNVRSGNRSSSLSALGRETLDEYMVTFLYLTERLKRFEKRITELSERSAFNLKVKCLRCIKGIDTLSAMTLLTEIGDISRFKSPEHLTSYLGLVPGEASSGAKGRRLGITKAGNSHVRKMLVECAKNLGRGAAGKKSKKLISRQNELLSLLKNNKPLAEEIIAYADKACIRLCKRSRRMNENNKPMNVITVAMARELTCFVWGMLYGKRALDRRQSSSPNDVTTHDAQAGSPNPESYPRQDSRGEPLSLLSKKEVSPEPPSRKKPRGLRPGSENKSTSKPKTSKTSKQP